MSRLVHLPSSLLLTVALCACGAAQPATAPPAEAEPVGTLSLTPPTPEVGEPRLSVSSEVRVQFATLSLPPRATFTPPVSTCQDVLALMRSGELTLGGLGGAEDATLQVDDAVRFGPLPGGTLHNHSDAPAEIVLAFTRAAGHGFRDQTLASVEQSLRAPPHDDACSPAEPQAALPRVARGSQTPPLVVAAGSIRVRILLDAERNGARHGGLSIIEASPNVVVPEHTHPGANEAILIEAGGGEMRLGDDTLSLQAGSIILIPDDTVHSLQGAGEEELRAIQVYGPSGAEQRFRRLAEGGS